MRPRALILTFLLVAGFWFVTEHGNWNVQQLIQPISRSGKLWSDPVTAHGAGFGADEQNNIDIYKTNRLRHRKHHQHRLSARFLLPGVSAKRHRLRVHHQRRRRDRDQQSRGFRLAQHHGDAFGQEAVSGHCARHRPAQRSRDSQNQGRPEAAFRASGRFRQSGGGPESAGHRQSVRTRRNADHRHREFARPQPGRRGGQHARRPDPDRRRHQSRQQRRSAARFAAAT